MGTVRTDPPYVAAIDANQYPTMIGVSGTVGTSDTTGTAEIIRVGVNPATGAIYTEQLASDSGTTVNIASGTMQTLGTVGTVIGAGTLTNLGSMTNFGTGKEVTTVANLTNGSVNILTGTVTQVTTVSNLTNGSVVITVGTINAGTFQKNRASVGTAQAGTVTNANTLILSSNTTRISYSVTHEGTTTLYVGFGTAVTTGNGMPVMSNQLYSADDYTGAVYGIVSAGSVIVKTIEV